MERRRGASGLDGEDARAEYEAYKASRIREAGESFFAAHWHEPWLAARFAPAARDADRLSRAAHALWAAKALRAAAGRGNTLPWVLPPPGAPGGTEDAAVPRGVDGDCVLDLHAAVGARPDAVSAFVRAHCPAAVLPRVFGSAVPAHAKTGWAVVPSAEAAAAAVRASSRAPLHMPPTDPATRLRASLRDHRLAHLRRRLDKLSELAAQGRGEVGGRLIADAVEETRREEAVLAGEAGPHSAASALAVRRHTCRVGTRPLPLAYARPEAVQRLADAALDLARALDAEAVALVREARRRARERRAARRAGRRARRRVAAGSSEAADASSSSSFSSSEDEDEAGEGESGDAGRGAAGEVEEAGGISERVASVLLCEGEDPAQRHCALLRAVLDSSEGEGKGDTPANVPPPSSSQGGGDDVGRGGGTAAATAAQEPPQRTQSSGVDAFLAAAAGMDQSPALRLAVCVTYLAWVHHCAYFSRHVGGNGGDLWHLGGWRVAWPKEEEKEEEGEEKEKQEETGLKKREEEEEAAAAAVLGWAEAEAARARAAVTADAAKRRREEARTTEHALREAAESFVEEHVRLSPAGLADCLVCHKTFRDRGFAVTHIRNRHTEEIALHAASMQKEPALVAYAAAPADQRPGPEVRYIGSARRTRDPESGGDRRGGRGRVAESWRRLLADEAERRRQLLEATTHELDYGDVSDTDEDLGV